MDFLSTIKNKLCGITSHWRPLIIVGGTVAVTAGVYYVCSKFIRQHRTANAEDCHDVDPDCESSQASTSQSDTDMQDSGLLQEFDTSAGPAVNDGTLCGSQDERSGLGSLTQQRRVTVDDFSFHKVLGEGGYGKVILAEMKGTSKWFAIKVLKKSLLGDADAERAMVEKRVLTIGQHHPFICSLYATFQSKERLFFVMEFLNGGDLAFHVIKSGPFELSRATFYAAEIVSGLKFLHRNGIIHRDLKLDNVQLDRDGHIKIVDFGLCKENVSADNLVSEICGTPQYVAPEILMNQEYSFSVDWWSFGVVVYAMLTQRFPFYGENAEELIASIIFDQPKYPHWLTVESRDMLQQLFDRDPTCRLGVLTDIRDHPFFTTVNWSAVENKEVEPPFKPELNGPNDHRYFHQLDLSKDPCLSSCEESLGGSTNQSIFSGFSFTGQKMKDFLK